MVFSTEAFAQAVALISVTARRGKKICNMPTSPCEIILTDRPLAPSPPGLSAASGAVVDFWGVVRGAEGKESIVAIRYEAFPAMARHQLERLAQRALERFAVNNVLLHHRLGIVPVAEASLFLRVAAKHRGPAFAAAQWIVAELKVAVPIWKHPLDADGREVPSVDLPALTAVAR